MPVLFRDMDLLVLQHKKRGTTVGFTISFINESKESESKGSNQKGQTRLNLLCLNQSHLQITCSLFLLDTFSTKNHTKSF